MEPEVPAILDDARRPGRVGAEIAAVAGFLSASQDVVVFNSRTLVTATGAAASLSVGRRVSDALIEVVRGLEVQPRFLIAKGGITSSDYRALAEAVAKLSAAP